jgi:hypothetical protein
MMSFFKRLWLRRWFRLCVWVAVTLFTLLVLLRQYVDWSGARRWAAAQQMLEHEGESLDFRQIVPDAVPDDQNFCAIPPLKDLAIIPEIDDEKSEQGLQRMRLVNAEPPRESKAGPTPGLLQGATLGKATDMQAWAAWLRRDGSKQMPPESGNPARDVVEGLSGDQALMDELALGLSRPESQWTPAWKARDLGEPLFETALPQYSTARGLVMTLCLRSAAAARAGDSVTAHQSLLIAVRLNQATLADPFLIGTLVACSNSLPITGAVWELCDAHCGTAEDFRKLQAALSRLDFKESLMGAERGETTLAADFAAYIAQTRSLNILQRVNPNGTPDLGIVLGLLLAPSGWFDANAATVVQWQFEYGIQPLRDGGFPEFLSKQKELATLLAGNADDRPFWHPDEVLARINMPSLWRAGCKVVQIQSVVNEAIAACALERYRLEHNAYPDTLEAANHPGEPPIPLDILSGNPMGYRKTPDGSYTLWCTAINGTNHGGKRILDPKHPDHTAFADPAYSGDWVWDFPAQ